MEFSRKSRSIQGGGWRSRACGWSIHSTAPTVSSTATATSPSRSDLLKTDCACWELFINHCPESCIARYAEKERGSSVHSLNLCAPPFLKPSHYPTCDSQRVVRTEARA